MMIDALVTGRLINAPVSRVIHPGRPPIATCKVRVTGSGETWHVHCTARSSSAVAALMQLQEGMSAALSGELLPKVRTDSNGTSHPEFDLNVHAILGLVPLEAK